MTLVKPGARNQPVATRWMARAACSGLDPDPWYPERGQSTAEARAVSASCPVLVLCLVHALRSREKHGVWGGASERVRRRLRVAWLSRGHDYRDGCGCSWCSTVDDHRAWLDASSPLEGPVWLNGPGAVHGKRATYARGCRCGVCSLAISSLGRRLEDAGFDVPGWWWGWFRGRRERDLLGRARVLAQIDLDERSVAA